MAKVEFVPEIFASETVIQEAIDAAAAILPNGKEPPSADVQRDAAGKVVKVAINLPYDLAASDLQAATDAIAKNNGVATTIQFPLPGDSDPANTMEGALPAAGADVVSLSDGKLVLVKSASEMEGIVSSVGEAITGTKSLKCQDINAAVRKSNFRSVYANILPSAFGLSLITAWETSLKIKALADGDTPDTSYYHWLQRAGFTDTTNTMYANATIQKGETNWHLQISTSYTGDTDLGVPTTTAIELKVRFIQALNQMEVWVDGVLKHTANKTMVPMTRGVITFGSGQASKNADSEVLNFNSIITDDLIINILDGRL